MSTPRSNFVKLRLTDLEKKDWIRAAGGSRKLSEWIRFVCNTAALSGGEELGSETGARALAVQVSPPPESAVPNEKPLIVSAAIQESVQGEQAHRESRSLPATQALGDDSSSGKRKSAPGGDVETCPRWMHHRPGVYCGSCKKVQK